jgi:hypothetical protein
VSNLLTKWEETRMTKLTFLLVVAAVIMVGCGEKPAPVKPRVEKDPRVTAAEEKINKTSPEGKAIIEKVQAMKPEVNEQVATKTLKEIADDFAENKGAYNITPIGWEASQKKPLPNEKAGRWKIIFYYQDYQKQFTTAEWEYNPETNKLYPFEKNNAPGFFSNEGAEEKKGK